jgi:Glycosyltransferase family 87
LQFKFLLRDISLGANRTIPFAYVLWFAVAFIAVLAELLHHSINNYLIFKNVFWHVVEQKNLYLRYPAEYEDQNLYGPIFSFVIAPFSILPDGLGVILWVMANAALLFYAIRELPFTDKAITVVFLIAVIEFMTSSHNVQFNPMVAACIILSYTFIHKEKDFWAAFFIALGFLAKIYGIVGIMFFVFSRHKLKFTGSFLFWLIVLFILPMIISSPHFIIQTYKEWFYTLTIKNVHNEDISFINMQDLTVMGMIRRTFRYAELSNLTVIVPAVILLGLPLLRFKLHQNTVFQLYYLCLALISVVIFSSSAESATYVIAMVGVAVWYVINMRRQSSFYIIVLVFALFITSLCSTDLVPQFIKHDIVRKYALKALPCFVVWLIIIYNVAFKKEEELKSPVLKLT